MAKPKRPRGILCCGEPMKVVRTARRHGDAIERHRVCKFCGTKKVTCETPRPTARAAG